MTLTIGFDASRNFMSQPTGTERYADMLLRHMLQLSEHHFRLYMRQEAETRLPGISSRGEMRVLPAKRLWTHRRLAAELRSDPPDALFIPAHVMPIACAVPTVVTVHDLGYEYFPEAHTLQQRQYLRWSTRRHVEKAAHLIVDSEQTAEDLKKFYGATDAQMTTAHLAADPTMQPASAEARIEARQVLGLNANEPYFLHVGTLQPRKNLARLLQAFQPLALQEPHLKLVLVGAKGWGRSDLPKLAEELEIEEQVVLPGYLPRIHLPAAYSAAHCLVMPSLYEGFGMPVLEAMACGTPVLYATGSSLDEVAGDAGLACDPLSVDSISQGLESMLRDGDLRERLSRRGPERASKFSWHRCAKTVLDVLEAVVEAAELDEGPASAMAQEDSTSEELEQAIPAPPEPEGESDSVD